MRKLFPMSWILATALLAGTVAFACGDKLMLLVGSARYGGVYSGAHPASILAYGRENSLVPEVVRDLAHRPALKKSGHTFQSVEDSSGLDEALKTGKYDLLMVDAADADRLQSRLLRQAESAFSRPTVLPVISKSNKAEANQVEKKFHCVLRAPGSVSHYLTAIDEAMESRSKRGSGKYSR